MYPLTWTLCTDPSCLESCLWTPPPPSAPLRLLKRRNTCHGIELKAMKTVMAGAAGAWVEFLTNPPPLCENNALCQNNTRRGFHNLWGHGIWWCLFLVVNEYEVFFRGLGLVPSLSAHSSFVGKRLGVGVQTKMSCWCSIIMWYWR